MSGQKRIKFYVNLQNIQVEQIHRTHILEAVFNSSLSNIKNMLNDIYGTCLTPTECFRYKFLIPVFDHFIKNGYKIFDIINFEKNVMRISRLNVYSQKNI